MKDKEMIKLDSYNREIKLDDLVNIDSMFSYKATGQVVGFTKQKVKVYNAYYDRDMIIKPKNLTLLTEYNN
jgi:hypothetical protein